MCSGYRIVEGDYIHTYMTCNTEEPQHRHRLGTVSKDYWVGWGGWLNMISYIKPSPFFLLQWFETFGPHEGSLTHQWIIIENKQIMDKTYKESETKTRQKQRTVIPGVP